MLKRKIRIYLIFKYLKFGDHHSGKMVCMCVFVCVQELTLALLVLECSPLLCWVVYKQDALRLCVSTDASYWLLSHSASDTHTVLVTNTELVIQTMLVTYPVLVIHLRLTHTVLITHTVLVTNTELVTYTLN